MYYLFQVSVVFSVLYILYILVFSKLTFHKTNRALLLLLIPISFVIPLSNIFFPAITETVIEVPLFEIINTQQFNAIKLHKDNAITSSINFSFIIITVYVIGCIICLTKFYLTNKKIIALQKQSTTIKKENHSIIIADTPIIFSYFNWIFIPKHKANDYDKLIIEHEKTHIKLKHSVDLIVVACYILIFWFNPFVYFYRKTLKSVHEYQADKGVLKTNVKTSYYLQLLANSININNTNNLYSYFDYPEIKKRIEMITQQNSKSVFKLNYIILFPICFILMSAFTKPNIKPVEIIQTVTKSAKNTPPLFVFPIKNATKKDISSFYGKTRHLIKNKKREKHGGIDIRANLGTPIYAAADGTIVKAAMEGNWGNLIIIKHSDGFETWYAHLKDFTGLENKKVKKGDLIGHVGVTGASSGPHLHFEIKQNNKRLNPLNYLK